MKTKFSAGWSLPGCLPEMEPALFDTQEEGEAYIAEEQERSSDLYGGLGFGRDSEKDDPYEYWVEAVVLDDCPFCDTGAATVPVWQAAPLDDTLACEDCAALSLPNV